MDFVETIRFVEELSCNSWPAIDVLLYDGWLLRLSEGYTRRANSVNPLYASSLPLDEKIDYCESVYAAHRLVPAFKLTADHSELDARLAERGYREDVASFVMINSDVQDSAPLNKEFLPDRSLLQSMAVVKNDGPTEPWLHAYLALSGVDLRYKVTMTRMLNRIPFTKALVVIMMGDNPVAAGMSVIERSYMSFYDIVVAEALRGQGLGALLMRYLMEWGRQNGAQHGYLQVSSVNAPAIKLYQRLGFREAYKYWYRVKEATSNLSHKPDQPKTGALL